jgi:deoxyribodipyrimidine photo-lyase
VAGSAVQVVWFKRDLRVRDHAPLHAAAEIAAQGGAPVLPLYVIEPSLWFAPDADRLHWNFVAASLRELQERLARRGAPLVLRTGEVVEVLRELQARRGIAALWSHEETGTALTFARDRAVAAFARAAGIEWRELPQNGVVRRLRDRDGWARRWTARMQAPPLPAPGVLPPHGEAPGEVPDLPQPIGNAVLVRDAPAALREAVQPGGEREAWTLLGSFLDGRGRDYRRGMSSPVTGANACSRLSPHLAFGTLSLRNVVHHAEAAAVAAVEMRAAGVEPPVPATALRAFSARLHWHCHFMQKLESEPAIETRCFHRGYEGLRDDLDAMTADARLAAWLRGETGQPFIDACMRSLQSTGWINFRMRAMLTSYAAYDLWLDWRRLRDPLARQFVDYEPGIHISQLQMQSGTTGINTLRIYNPQRQAEAHDPDGAFIRAWVPALARVPAAYLHQPWLMGERQQREAGCRLGKDYPLPLVDHAAAIRHARSRISEARLAAGMRAESARVFDRHGSRRGPQDTAAGRALRERRLAGDDGTTVQRTRSRSRTTAPGQRDQLGLFPGEDP